MVARGLKPQADCTLLFSFIQSFIQDNDALLFGLGVFSLMCFFVTLAIIPWLVVKLPHDYFAGRKRNAPVSGKLPFGMRIVVLVLKNCLGLVIIMLGIIMLIIPGQGVLTMVIGLILIDFPGKYRLERSLMQRKHVLKTVNWLRARGQKPPLKFGNS